MKIEEMPRASVGDTIELEGKVSFAKKPNSKDFDGEIVWGQFVVLKDETGEQGCWLKLKGKDGAVTKETTISIKGKLGEEYEDKKGVMKRSINNCDFEVIGKAEEKTQGPAQSSVKENGNGKVDDKVWKEKDLRMARESALKNVTQFVVAKIVKIADRFKYAQEDVDFIYKDMNQLTSENITKEFGGTAEEIKEATKEERTKKAEEVVGKTRFKPASTNLKNIIFGYKDEKGKFYKGMIDSRYIETHEIKKIGDPKKLSVEDAGKWIEFWWGEQGNPDDIGARKQREIDNPRDENGKLVNALVKGDKTSVTKDMLVDEIYALRRENRLNDDEKFKEVMGYNPKIEELTEAECIKVKGLLKNYVPF